MACAVLKILTGKGAPATVPRHLVNTPIGRKSQYDDSYIRKAAIKHKVLYITTLAAALAAAKGIEAYKKGHGDVKSLQKYHAELG